MQQVQHNLDIAKPIFLNYQTNINWDMFKWIQYKGFEVADNGLYFIFKSSQNSLSFKVYAGVNTNDITTTLLSKSNEIYNYFRELKYSNK
jgi:hypothetical protein